MTLPSLFKFNLIRCHAPLASFDLEEKRNASIADCDVRATVTDLMEIDHGEAHLSQIVDNLFLIFVN